MTEVAAHPDPSSSRRVLLVAGTLLFVLGMLLYGIFLPFFECGILIPDCYFIPLGLYYPMLAGAFGHLFVVWFVTILRKETRPEWLWWVSLYHTGVLVLSGAIYLTYHLFHPGWHETDPGFSMDYRLLKPWHEVVGEELVFPFMLASTLFLFFNPRVKWWLKPIILVGLGILVLVP